MWPFGRGKHERVDPHQHHPFEEPGDAGMSAAASGGGGTRGTGPNAISFPAASQRRTRCAVPGCGKFHDDPIHMPADD